MRNYRTFLMIIKNPRWVIGKGPKCTFCVDQGGAIPGHIVTLNIVTDRHDMTLCSGSLFIEKQWDNLGGANKGSASLLFYSMLMN